MQVGTARFQEAERYAAYLQTTEGKLRVELAWTNLQDFQPASGVGGRALDLGGGTGILALRLAALGFSVDLLDSSEAMLDLARKGAKAEALSDQISFRCGDANTLSDTYQPCSFDVVVCHNLLEYLDEPSVVLHGLRRLCKRNAVVSLMVRNRFGEVLNSAIKGHNLELSKAALSADTVIDSLYGQPVRVFSPDDLYTMVERGGLEVVAKRGIRVLSDYLSCGAFKSEDYRRLFDFELWLGAQPHFAAVARYTQIIARPVCGSGGERKP